MHRGRGCRRRDPWLAAAACFVSGLLWALGLTAEVNAQAQGQAPSQAPSQVSTAAPAPATTTPDAALVDEGRRRYTGMCARCHGLNLVTTGIGFDLRRFPREDKERFVRSINKGLKAMPAFEGSIKPAEIDALWAYIGAVNGWGP